MMDHPNIVNYKECFEDNRYLFIVMDSIEEGHELNKLVLERLRQVEADPKQAEAPLFSEDQVMRLIHMLVSSLSHVHSNEVVHRDIKAENCLVDKNMKLFLIDFGLAKMIKDKDEQKLIVGSELYMAPEIFDQDGDESPYGPPCDIWAVGILMFRLLSGQFPFQGFEVQN